MKKGKRNPVTISLDQAKQMYQIENLKGLALAAYTKDELEGIKPPESGEKFLLESGGWFIDSQSGICRSDNNTYPTISDYKFPELAQAEACVALSRLCQLRAHPFWVDKCSVDDGNWRHVIVSKRFGVLEVGETLGWNRFLSFNTKSGAEMFLDMYRDVIKIAAPFI